MKQDVLFLLKLSLLIVVAMTTLGLIIDGARIVIYGASFDWKGTFTFTLSMAVLGIVIAIANVLKFFVSSR